MKAYLDTREGKFAVYVMGNSGLVIHSGQHGSEEAAHVALTEQLNRIVRSTEAAVRDMQGCLEFWSEASEALSLDLIPRDPVGVE